MVTHGFKKRLCFIASLFICAYAWAAPQANENWTVTQVAEGIVYYSYSGADDISGANQRVFVLDWDMSNPSYALRYTWSAKGRITSDVFRSEDAVAAINAAYEPSSTVLKVGGHFYSCMPYDTVMTTPVPNWKSEAAIYADDNGRNVKIAFDGKGKSIAEQRKMYLNSDWNNIFSSAPMLIDDYEPVGAFYVDSTLTASQLEEYNYEDPIRHQGVRHPRTAVAITSDNHFLMIVVDGRKKGISEGMSARELTRFIEKNFHPRYALNMDGGGSTTLCVRGQGNPQTNVVNNPVGNRKKERAGQERSLFSHLCIVETPKEPRVNVREEVLADWNKSSGLDCVYDMAPKISTPAPKGYEATYVSHYGRHGSRYAYTPKAYTIPLEMLQEGEVADNLTAFGKDILEQLAAFWEASQYRVGDLTETGWNQQAYISRTMVESFPKVFAKGSVVDACSSPSVRSIISMSSFISTLSREAPKSAIYAHQSQMDVQATRPNSGPNPFRYKGPESIFPYAETSEEFFLRRFPQYEDVLGRLFKNPTIALGGRNAYDVFFNLYMLVAGMNSLPEPDRMDLSGIFTREEYAVLWEIDNYERLKQYLPYRTPCSSIVRDIIDKADIRLSQKSRGADLRFGHDHVVMSLLMIMDIDDFGKYPSNPDNLVEVFQTFRSCMATNLQLVFYTPRKCKESEPLVKILLNGEEARFGSLEGYDGPYYKWSEVKEYLQHRISLFVN